MATTAEVPSDSARQSGARLELSSDELPDHLGVVLEYAATVDPKYGRRILLDHRAGVELGYLWRPYVVYRSRDTRLGARAARRGWERVG